VELSVPTVLDGLKRRAERLGVRLASWPVRLLGDEPRGRLIEEIFDSMTFDVPVGAKSFRFATPTPTLRWRARTALSKEPDTIGWIDRFQPDDVLWDIGANVGVFSLYAAAIRGTRVVAFEPAAGNYMMLCRNVELNGLDNRVVAYCLALSGETRLGVLNSAERALGGALHQFGERGDSSVYWSEAGCIAHQGMTGFAIDDFIRLFNPPFPTHVKIDVDGLELPILRGAAATLHDRRLSSVMVELSLTDRAECELGLELLSQAGFELVAQGERQQAGGAAAANHFFARKL